MARQDFTGPPLVAGELRGVRHFQLRYDGALIGPTYPMAWGAGENVARHKSAYWGDFFETLNDESHKVASQGCTCGFYAYYDVNDSPYQTGMVHNYPAIISAYGTVSVGPRGFRAQKARIIAISSQANELSWFERGPDPDEFTRLITEYYPEVEVHHSKDVMFERHPTPRPFGLPDPGPKEDNPKIVTGQIVVSAGWSAPTSQVYITMSTNTAGYTSQEDSKPDDTPTVTYHYRDNPPPKPGWTQVSPAVHRYLPRNHQR